VGCVISTFVQGLLLVIEFSQLGCTSIVGRCQWLIYCASRLLVLREISSISQLSASPHFIRAA